MVEADVLFDANRMFSTTTIKINAISSFFRVVWPVRCSVLHVTVMKFQVKYIQGVS